MRSGVTGSVGRAVGMVFARQGDGRFPNAYKDAAEARLLQDRSVGNGMI